MLALIAAAALALPAPDRLVDAGAAKLHIRCEGERRPGAPIVVLEAGAGNSAKTWKDVFGPIAQLARVCAYDRQGLGTSEPTPKPQGFAEVVETLHALLRAADERPPFVMAGHSYGGALIRLYATRYPSEIAGLVLIDASHEQQLKRFAAVSTPAGAAGPQMTEQIDLPGMERELSAAPWHANIPLVVLTRTPSTDPNADPRGAIWQEMQRELGRDHRRASRSSPGRADTTSRTTSRRSSSTPSAASSPGRRHAEDQLTRAKSRTTFAPDASVNETITSGLPPG